MFRDGWIILNKVPIHISTWGCWIEDIIPGDAVLLFITGNPGVSDFYYQFLSTLQPLIDMPIWMLSQAGCELPPYDLEMPTINANPELYDLSAQIEEKKQFIKKYISKSYKIYVVAHSIGGKIAIELLKDEEIARNVEQVHLLFPTLQHIGKSPNGKIYTNIIQYIVPVFVFFAWVFSCLPKIVKVFILSTFHSCRTDWNCRKEPWLEGVLKLFTSVSTHAALHLAVDEMKTVKDLDAEVYDKYYSKINIYYGRNDRWAPLWQYHHLMEQHPKVKGRILDEKFTHSFVLTTSIEMAQLLCKEIITVKEEDDAVN